jgi:hypothetical protein
LKEITLYWSEHRTNLEPTYVYYGALPAFGYSLRYYELDTEPLPPAWLIVCWNHSTEEVCARDNIYYGEWFRSQSSERIRRSIERTLGGFPHRFWLIFSHVYPGEDQQILGELLERYKIINYDEQVNASAYLLEMNH